MEQHHAKGIINSMQVMGGMVLMVGTAPAPRYPASRARPGNHVEHITRGGVRYTSIIR